MVTGRADAGGLAVGSSVPAPVALVIRWPR